MSEPGARSGWWLDELASAGRENLDAAHVARYDAKEDASGAAEVGLLRRLGLGPDSAVVEFGAGTGQFTVPAASAFGRVIAVDVSPVMLAALRFRLSAGPVADTVEVVEAGFLSYVHAGDPVDAVYSRYALHHLPDFWKAVALTRVRAILRPGGVLRLWDVVYDFPPDQAETRIEAWCATGGTDAEGDWTRAELEEHVRDEHSTFSWLLEPMLVRAGFAVETAEHAPDGIFARYVARAV